MLARIRDTFSDVFNNPLRRQILVTTVCLVISVICFLAFDMRRLNRIFYKPERSVLFNIVNFVAVMAGCFAFGFVFSRLQLWIHGGSARQEPDARERKGKKKHAK